MMQPASLMPLHILLLLPLIIQAQVIQNNLVPDSKPPAGFKFQLALDSTTPRQHSPGTQTLDASSQPFRLHRAVQCERFLVPLSRRRRRMARWDGCISLHKHLLNTRRRY
ncbi:hypothetical protein BC830DRAFT_769430 [Chytriomyces sp. MP71]|nr:hypothetical protein BC830DRAFT_769430 [Chytriomyces sp. MP71]